MEGLTKIAPEQNTAEQPTEEQALLSPIEKDSHQLTSPHPSQLGTAIVPMQSSLTAPVSQQAINHLILNCIIPGSGTLLHKKTSLGLAQLSLMLFSFPLMMYSILPALLLLAGSYLWSIVTGIQFTKEKEDQLTWE